MEVKVYAFKKEIYFYSFIYCIDGFLFAFESESDLCRRGGNGCHRV